VFVGFLSFKIFKRARLVMAPSGPRISVGGRRAWFSAGKSGVRGGTRGAPINVGVSDRDVAKAVNAANDADEGKTIRRAVRFTHVSSVCTSPGCGRNASFGSGACPEHL